MPQDKTFGGDCETCLQILIHSYHEKIEFASLPWNLGEPL